MKEESGFDILIEKKLSKAELGDFLKEYYKITDQEVRIETFNSLKEPEGSLKLTVIEHHFPTGFLMRLDFYSHSRGLEIFRGRLDFAKALAHFFSTRVALETEDVHSDEMVLIDNHGEVRKVLFKDEDSDENVYIIDKVIN